MGNVIYCETKETTTPYIFANTRIAAYSYEEVCYYIFQNPSMISLEYLGAEFIQWLREKLKMNDLAEHLEKKMQEKCDLFDYLEVLLLAANFYEREEVYLLFERMKEELKLPKALRLKRQADGFIRFHKYVRAIRIYDAILLRDDIDLEFRSTIYHNKGVALSKNFELHRAQECYLKAYETFANELSLSCYIMLFFMLQETDKAKEEVKRLGVDEKTYQRIEGEYRRSQEGYLTSLSYEEYEKAREDFQYGRGKKAQGRIEKMLTGWKEDYRMQTT